MPNQGTGVRITGGVDGGAMQAFQAVPSAKVPPEHNQTLAYSPCSDELTMSQFLHHSAKWNFIYPSFQHIADLIKKELKDPNYCVNKNQGFSQILIGGVFFLPAIIFFFIAAFSKLYIDQFEGMHPYDHVANFINAYQSIGGFLLTVVLAGFALHVVFRNKKLADKTFKESEQVYTDYRKQLIIPHNYSWAFFALAELIFYLKNNNIDEITSFSPQIITKRNFVIKQLNRIHRQSGKLFSLDGLVSRDGIALDQSEIIKNILNLLTDYSTSKSETKANKNSKSKITLGKFGAIWGLLLEKMKKRFKASEYENNLRPYRDRILFRPAFIDEINDNRLTQHRIVEIIAIIASKKRNHVTSGLFKAMDLRQRFMKKHLQGALDAHRSHPKVFPVISDPSVVSYKELALEILVTMTNPYSGFRDCMILPDPIIFTPSLLPKTYDPVATNLPTAISNPCFGLPVVHTTNWQTVAHSDPSLPLPPQHMALVTDSQYLPGPLQQPLVPIYNSYANVYGLNTHQESTPAQTYEKYNPLENVL